MKKKSSIYLLAFGCILLPIGILLDNRFLLYSSIIFNIIAIVLSFKEKNEHK
ncbi:hypothetical protein [Flavobacterium soli]|uniref:hypothetical protein n=1 Tax=Flavobacterium soli TaxID=344881 RepID=UPI0012F7AF19|nr:hypothetical protein [Flavobacterium soli]